MCCVSFNWTMLHKPTQTTPLFTELALECAAIYFKYGSCLFYKAQDEADFLGEKTQEAVDKRDGNTVNVCGLHFFLVLILTKTGASSVFRRSKQSREKTATPPPLSQKTRHPMAMILMGQQQLAAREKGRLRSKKTLRRMVMLRKEQGMRTLTRMATERGRKRRQTWSLPGRTLRPPGTSTKPTWIDLRLSRSSPWQVTCPPPLPSANPRLPPW